MKKQDLAVSLLLIVVIAACITPFGILFGVPFLQEWRTRQGLEIINGAEHLLDGYSVYGGSTAKRTIFYWIDKPINEVKGYYERFTAAFVQGEDEYGTWYITLIEGEIPISQHENNIYIIHESFCNYEERYDCVSIALIDISQPDYFQLAASSPSQFRNLQPPPEFAHLPGRGTLIIFSYYVLDF